MSNPLAGTNNPWLRLGAMIMTTKGAHGYLCDFEKAREAVTLQFARIAQLEAENTALKAQLVVAQKEVTRLNALINTPQTADFLRAVKLEAAHQQERWGVDGDAGKAPADWFWLLGYLSGKALAAFVKGDTEKGLHHTISSAAALLNWHGHASGLVTKMRPGIDAAIAAKEQK